MARRGKGSLLATAWTMQVGRAHAHDDACRSSSNTAAMQQGWPARFVSIWSCEAGDGFCWRCSYTLAWPRKHSPWHTHASEQQASIRGRALFVNRPPSAQPRSSDRALACPCAAARSSNALPVPPVAPTLRSTHSFHAVHVSAALACRAPALPPAEPCCTTRAPPCALPPRLCLFAGLAASHPGLAKLVVGLIFPVGLTMVTICGAELYTGNTATVTVAVFEKKATWGELAKNWITSYLGE